MHLYKMKLLRIIAEPDAVEHIIDTINRFHLRGFTVYDGAGVGRHTRDSSLSALAKRKIVEVVTLEETAEQLLKALHDDLFARYAIVAYLEDVKVVRREKFS